MVATGPEGAHGGDSHAAELLTVQNGGMDSDMQPIPGLKLGNVATPHCDTFTFLGRVMLHLPAKTGKSLKNWKTLRCVPACPRTDRITLAIVTLLPSKTLSYSLYRAEGIPHPQETLEG